MGMLATLALGISASLNQSKETALYRGYDPKLQTLELEINDRKISIDWPHGIPSFELGQPMLVEYKCVSPSVIPTWNLVG